MELLKHPSFFSDLDRPDVIYEAFKVFSKYLEFTEEKLVSNAGAVTSLDALLLFSIGVIIAAAIQRGSNAFAELSKVANILTLLSSRYESIRDLRNIISELQQHVSQGQSQDRLCVLVAGSKVTISEPIQSLIFGDGRDRDSINHSVLD